MMTSSSLHGVYLCSETFPPVYDSVRCLFHGFLPENTITLDWVSVAANVKGPTERTWDGSRLCLLPKPVSRGVGGLSRAYWRHFAWAHGACNRLLDNNKSALGIVIARDDPALALAGYRSAKARDLPFVYQLSHFKEEEVLSYARSGLYGHRAKYLLMGLAGLLVRNALLRRSNLVLPMSDVMEQTLIKRNLVGGGSMVLPEGVNGAIPFSEFRGRRETCKRQLGFEGALVFGYLGTLNKNRQLNILFPVLAALREAGLPAVLLFVGGGRESGDVDELRQEAGDLAPLVRFAGALPKDEALTTLAVSDIAFSPFPDLPVYRFNSPTKLFEYMALGLPVVASKVPEDQARVVAEAGCGALVTPTVRGYVEASLELAQLSDGDRTHLGEKGRRWVLEHRDFRKMANRLVARLVLLTEMNGAEEARR